MENEKVISIVHLIETNKFTQDIAICSNNKVFIINKSGEIKLLHQVNQEIHHQNQNKNYYVITSISFSEDGKYFACAGDDKLVHVWECGSWNLLGNKSAKKRISVCFFSRDNSQIVFCESTGTSYYCNLKDFSKSEPKFMFGHLSALIDCRLTVDGKFTISVDRSESIRVSHYPNSYNIHSFCMGHTKFVSKFIPVHSSVFVSGASDSTIKMWDINQSKLISSYAFENIPTDTTVTPLCVSTNKILLVYIPSTKKKSPLSISPTTSSNSLRRSLSTLT
eukprot:TRINITY_DN12333_c0_g1_i1.p1 TRINITY_DN12333_c0_g1~~TRINITY_DN12333_c0_g1_i1.p1  ORF type:complete len:278 (-),score=49.66 TRINITY_DN12333_c0_g1_i1:46-879(-)